ncbi:heavy metal translocating P-type ATPase, putative [Babesia ovata]|uniref:Heavy metal translocating P-type ATPase, putative n=1 Tax=Babesia ovata TaxID=189622 RepID=A0A2H6KDV9_9APIC|nr:heavy metal translocating P-type ATPase, putative [Babesia ovata]GBE61164.1 heavy metal translocating P-type ATPase, putative [Babesia ovata]
MAALSGIPLVPTWGDSFAVSCDLDLLLFADAPRDVTDFVESLPPRPSSLYSLNAASSFSVKRPMPVSSADPCFLLVSGPSESSALGLSSSKLLDFPGLLLDSPFAAAPLLPPPLLEDGLWGCPESYASLAESFSSDTISLSLDPPIPDLPLSTPVPAFAFSAANMASLMDSCVFAAVDTAGVTSPFCCVPGRRNFA